MAVRRVLLASLLAATVHAGDADRAVLAAQGIASDPESLGAYLRTLRLGERERAEAVEAVRNLGSDDPATRHEAFLRLGSLPAPPLEAIRGAASSDDAEVRRAAGRILDDMLRRTRKDLLLAALRTIADDGPKGLAGDVLGVAPLAAELQIPLAVTSALRATLDGRDLETLRAAARDGEMETRCAALRALGLAPGAGPDEAVPWLGAPEERLRLAAALALADRGDRRCIEALLGLLAADAPSVRGGAADALRAACGGMVGFDPFGSADARRTAIGKWRKWIEARPAGAVLRHPLPLRPPQLGRTLISLYAENRVIEVDTDGKLTFEVNGITGPWAVQGLPNGHRLVALYPLEVIVEYDAEGAEVSRLRVPGQPMGFHRIDNGDTLVAIREQDRVVELKPDGCVVTEFEVSGNPIDVRLLDNSHLLVCVTRPPRVVELDPAGRECWSFDGVENPSTAQRLENGNTLVSTGSRVVEVDAKGRIIWERTGLRQCYSAERLPDGSMLAAGTEGVRVTAPDGKERWLFRTTTYARASRY